VIPQDDHYASGRELLVQRLANVGVEQFIVPDDFGETVAHTLAASCRPVGFCLTHSDLLHRGWKMIGVPSAVIFPAASARQASKDHLWSFIRERRHVLDGRPSLMLYIIPRDTKLDGTTMYFSADAGDGFHIWRQRFPRGTPEQMRFGATERRGSRSLPTGGRW
jgi:hypothetical protein